MPAQSPMQSPGQSTATQQVGIERRAPVPLSVYLEGIRAGLVGASIIAVWFLLVDTVAGHPFYTPARMPSRDRKSTRLNSSHLGISYAVFCLKKKNTHTALI